MKHPCYAAPSTHPASRFVRGARSAYRLWYRANFAPKYRKRLLVGDVARGLLSVFRRVARDYGYHLMAVGIVDDHVHVVIGLPTTVAIATAVQTLKSISARELFAAVPALRQAIGADHLWASGCSVQTLGWVNPAHATEYVRNQARHHGRDALVWTSAEVPRRDEGVSSLEDMPHRDGELGETEKSAEETAEESPSSESSEQAPRPTARRGDGSPPQGAGYRT